MAEFIAQFHFIRPWWLLGFIPVLALIYWLLQKHSASNQWSRHIAPNLLEHLLDKKQIKQNKWPVWGTLFLWLCTCLALAGPSWKKIPQPVEQTTEALVICWDLSPSMLAQDIQPSRLQRARLKIIDLLNARDEGLFALVAYSGEAYNVTPLTDDIKTIVNLLPALSPTYLPTVGSNPEMAFDNANQLLKDAGNTVGHIVLVTDGIDPNAFDYLQGAAKESPYKLTIWAVGTDEGAPIPLPNGGFAKDKTGNMIIPSLNEREMQSFATRASAYYVPMVTNDSDIKTLNTLLSPNKQQTAKTERNFDQWFEHGQYFALLLLPFAALLFRKGWIFSLLILFSAGFTPKYAQAFTWQDLWQTQDQQAQQQLQQGDEEAAKNFSTPERRGTALYEQQKFEQAAAEFEQQLSAKNQYNLGTALTQAGKYEEAISAFEEAIKLNPNLNQAYTNKAIAQKLAELQKKQQQQNQNSDNSEQNDQQQGDNNSENQEGSEQSSNQQNNDQKSNDQQNSGQQNNSSNSQNQQSQSGHPNDEEQQNSDSNSQNAQSDQNSEGQQAEEQQNPYADVEPEQNNSEDQTQAGTPQQEQAPEGDQQSAQEAMALTGAMDGEKSEEQQQLEVMLRKVPDDPGGLLREKFKYQYQQRKRDPTHSFSNKEAENRW